MKRSCRFLAHDKYPLKTQELFLLKKKNRPKENQEAMNGCF